jgi:hypothetical protein
MNIGLRTQLLDLYKAAAPHGEMQTPNPFTGDNTFSFRSEGADDSNSERLAINSFGNYVLSSTDRESGLTSTFIVDSASGDILYAADTLEGQRVSEPNLGDLNEIIGELEEGIALENGPGADHYGTDGGPSPFEDAVFEPPPGQGPIIDPALLLNNMIPPANPPETPIGTDLSGVQPDILNIDLGDVDLGPLDAQGSPPTLVEIDEFPGSTAQPMSTPAPSDSTPVEPMPEPNAGGPFTIQIPQILYE